MDFDVHVDVDVVGLLLAELFPSPGVLCDWNRKDHEDRQDHGFEVLEVFAVFGFER